MNMPDYDADAHVDEAIRALATRLPAPDEWRNDPTGARAALHRRVAAEDMGPPAPPVRLPKGVVFHGAGGSCPVQGYGAVDGVPFVFTARWDAWRLDVGLYVWQPPGDPEPGEHARDEGMQTVTGACGTGMDASFLTPRAATQCVVEGITRYRARVRAAVRRMKAAKP